MSGADIWVGGVQDSARTVDRGSDRGHVAACHTIMYTLTLTGPRDAALAYSVQDGEAYPRCSCKRTHSVE